MRRRLAFDRGIDGKDHFLDTLMARPLDEPTANLSVVATERLLETMLELKKHGVAQIIISHRLQDIFAVGDRVMVLKRGENVGDRYVKDTDEHEVLEIIVSGTREQALSADAARKRPARAAAS